MPIPGAEISVSPEGAGPRIVTWTDVDGSYSAAVAYGTYVVEVQMVAFAKSTQRVAIGAADQKPQVNFEMTLQSRVQQATPQRRQVIQAGQRGFQTLSAMQNGANQDNGANKSGRCRPQ
jgi:hypothetical protein